MIRESKYHKIHRRWGDVMDDAAELKASARLLAQFRRIGGKG